MNYIDLSPNLVVSLHILFALTFLSLLLFWCCYNYGPQMFLGRRKWILKTSNNKPNDLFRNISSMIPNKEKVERLEEKAVVSFKDIKESLKSRFNCTINFIACGSIPVRFGVPLIDNWIDDIDQTKDRYALLSDQDFLIEASGITASYSSLPHAVEIVQNRVLKKALLC